MDAVLSVPDPETGSLATESKDHWDEREVIEVLKRCDRFGLPTYALLAQVHGHVSGTRAADGVSVGLWRSRGLTIQGFEIKVSRSDWLREIKKPEKAEQTVFNFCDKWWLITPKKSDVVRTGEIPQPWGHATVTRAGVHVVKEAPSLNPSAIDRPFVAELFRHATEQLPSEVLLAEARKKGFAEGVDRGEENQRNRVAHLRELSESQQRIIDSFEKVIGQSLHTWSQNEHTEEVRRGLEFVLRNGHEGAIRELEGVRERVARILEGVDEQLSRAKTPSEEGA